jgi:pyruvate/2-oxoglutarate dehydrogenase complex dihydrolipoamide acyltransferase (E2) component
MNSRLLSQTASSDVYLPGPKLGFMSCFIKAAAKALRDEPAVNAIIDGDEIVYRNYFDISIAVSAPKAGGSFRNNDSTELPAR